MILNHNNYTIYFTVLKFKGNHIREVNLKEQFHIFRHVRFMLSSIFKKTNNYLEKL